MTRARDGFVLAVAAIGLVALTLLAHGALLVARHEERVSRSAARMLQASAAAEGVVAREAVSAGSPGGEVGRWRSGEAGEDDGGRWSLASFRLEREWWLVEGVGRPPAGSGEARVRALVWRLDPAARVAAFPGVLSVPWVAAASIEGAVDGTSVRWEDGGAPPAYCLARDAVLDSLGLGALPARGATGGAPAGEPRLGLLEGEDLVALLPALAPGAGRPGPVETGGACLDAPWSWGAPDGSGSACAGRAAARGVSGDLDVEGGWGHVFLVVAGDLRVRGGAELSGLVLVGGSLTVDGGARVVGLVRAGAGAWVAAGSSVVGSACAALHALESAEPLVGGARIPPGAANLGPVR